MTSEKWISFCRVLIGCVFGLLIQFSVTAAPAPVVPASTAGAASAASSATSMVGLPPEALKLPPSQDAIISKIEGLEKTLKAAAESPADMAMRSGLFALATVAISVLASVFVQFKMMEHQRNLAADQAKAEISNSFVQWELKQVSELYGPLRALLGQSNAIYRQMCQVLVAYDRERFRLDDEAEGDFDHKVFKIKKGDAWVRFRTVIHMEEIYRKGPEIEPYFDELVLIGGRMVQLIEEKAGYTRSDQKELIGVMGQYLAHYLVLKRLHNAIKSEEGYSSKGKPEETATFPNEIQKLVDKGYLDINLALENWKAQGRS